MSLVHPGLTGTDNDLRCDIKSWSVWIEEVACFASVVITDSLVNGTTGYSIKV